jgi:hypothetical protein
MCRKIRRNVENYFKKEERLIPTEFNSLHPINTTDRLMPTAYPLIE